MLLDDKEGIGQGLKLNHSLSMVEESNKEELYFFREEIDLQELNI